MSSTNKTNEALRYQRLMRGWSLQRTADGIVELSLKQDGKRPGVNGDMVGEWERGVKVPSPFYREKLCLLYRATAEQLDLMNAPVPQLAHTYQLTSALTGKEDMIMKRRELLRLLSLAGAALILPLPDIVDWERIEGVLVRPSRLDEKVLRDLEAMNYHYWSIYRASSSKRVVLDGVLKQLKIMVGLLRGSHAALLHKWLCALVSDLGQLAGEVFFDANDYDAAQSCYTFAATAAKEGEHYDLWSCALIRHAFLPVYDEQFHDALPLLQEAQRLSYRGDTSLVTRFWAAAVEAEAQAGAGNLPACQAALDRAQKVVDVKMGANGGWLRFDGFRLPEQRGACFVRLGQPDLAESALQEALVQLPTLTRRRGMVLTDLALASLQHREVEHACAYATEVVEIAMLGSSGVLRKGLHVLRTQLEPFERTDAVKRLDRHMGVLI